MIISYSFESVNTQPSSQIIGSSLCDILNDNYNLGPDTDFCFSEPGWGRSVTNYAAMMYDARSLGVMELLSGDLVRFLQTNSSYNLIKRNGDFLLKNPCDANLVPSLFFKAGINGIQEIDGDTILYQRRFNENILTLSRQLSRRQRRMGIQHI